MPKRGRFSRLGFAAASMLVCAIVVACFFPQLVGTYWHLRHGNSIEFHEWTIPVPRGWWPQTDGSQLVIQKMTWNYDRNDSTVIEVLTMNYSQPVHIDALKKAVLNQMSRDGYAFRGDRDVDIGSSPGYCAKFVNDTRHRNIHIACWSLKNHLSLDLLGYARDVQTFYSVIDQIKPSKAQR